MINSDYFALEVPDSSVFRIPTLTIANTDLPLDVTLYDSARQVIQHMDQRPQREGGPAGKVHLLPEGVR